MAVGQYRAKSWAARYQGGGGDGWASNDANSEVGSSSLLLLCTVRHFHYS